MITKTPYEYLVRLNADGTVRGQHIKYLYRRTDDTTGDLISEVEGDAEAVGDAANQIPLETALGQINAALAKAEEAERGAKLAAQSGRAAAESARDAAQAERDQRAAERDQRAAERDALRAEIDALRGRSAAHVRKSVILRRMTAQERLAWRKGVRRAQNASNPSTADQYADDAMMIFQHVGPTLDVSDPDARSFGLALVAAGVLATEARVDELLLPE